MYSHHYTPLGLNSGFRVYEFTAPREAEEFADLFGGFARAGKDSNGRWLAFI